MSRNLLNPMTPEIFRFRKIISTSSLKRTSSNDTISSVEEKSSEDNKTTGKPNRVVTSVTHLPGQIGKIINLEKSMKKRQLLSDSTVIRRVSSKNRISPDSRVPMKTS